MRHSHWLTGLISPRRSAPPPADWPPAGIGRRCSAGHTVPHSGWWSLHSCPLPPSAPGGPSPSGRGLGLALPLLGRVRQQISQAPGALDLVVSHTAEQASRTISTSLPSSSRRACLLFLFMVRPLYLQLHPHRQSWALLVGQLQHALVPVDDLLGDGQAQSGPARLADRALSTGKTARRWGRSSGGMPMPLSSTNIHTGPPPSGGDDDAPSVRRVLDGVGHDVHHHLDHSLLVGHDLGQLRPRSSASRAWLWRWASI